MLAHGIPRSGAITRAVYDPAVTHYDVLGVSPGATASTIRRAFIEQARLHHPDFHANADASVRHAAERDMQRINDAWAVLGDPQSRREYDATLRAESTGGRSGGRVVAEPGSDWDPRSGVAHPDFVPFDPGDDPDYNALLDDLDDLDDTPYRNARPVARWQQVLPVGLFGAALGAMCLGLLASLSPLVGLGVVLLIASGVSFVMTPIVAVLRGHERDPDR